MIVCKLRTLSVFFKFDLEMSFTWLGSNLFQVTPVLIDSILSVRGCKLMVDGYRTSRIVCARQHCLVWRNACLVRPNSCLYFYAICNECSLSLAATLQQHYSNPTSQLQRVEGPCQVLKMYTSMLIS